MAEITVRRSGELMRAVFETVIDAGDGLPAKEVLRRVEHAVKLSEFEKSDYPTRPGVRRFEKTVRFISITFVKAGWLVKDKGRWSVTEEGQRAYNQYPDPDEFHRRARTLYREWQGTREPAEEEENPTPPSVTIEEAEENAWNELPRPI